MILSLALAQPSKQDAAFNTSLPSDGLRAFGVSHGMDQGAGPGQRRPPTKAASDQTVTAPDVGGWAMMHEREQVTRMGPLIKRLPNSLPPVVHNPGRLFKEISTRVLVIYLDSTHPACSASCPPGL